MYTDESEQWNWLVADCPACYDAIRIHLGHLARDKGLKRAEIILSDPFTARNYTDWRGEDFSWRGGVTITADRNWDDKAMGRIWPDWHDKLPDPGTARVSEICTDWPYNLEDYDLGAYTCRLYPLWGNPDTEQGRLNLGAAASMVLPRILGGVLFADQSGVGLV